MHRQLLLIILSSCFVLQTLCTSTDCNALQCPACWTAYKNHCYRYFDESKTWEEARQECRKYGSPNGFGLSDLVTLHSASEEVFVMGLAEDGTHNWFWIGFQDKTHENSFTWVSQEQVDYTNWIQGEPNNRSPYSNEDCTAVKLIENNGWNDFPCDRAEYKYPFVCKMRRV